MYLGITILGPAAGRYLIMIVLMRYYEMNDDGIVKCVMLLAKI